MALTQAQWYEKLKSWVPSWWFEEQQYNVALFRAFAKLASTLQQTNEDRARQTFLLDAEEQTLDAHGDERSVDRLPGESDALYRIRVRSLLNKSNVPAIKSIVDSLLIVGECAILENKSGLSYLSRGAYLGWDVIVSDYSYNYYTIVVDRQSHPPYSFASRGDYASRSAFVGTTESQDYVYNSVVKAVDALKAFGTFYRVVERRS